MATLTPENRRRRAKDDKDDDLDDADDFGALFEAPKRVALTAEQKVKLAEWYNIAETNLKIHQISEKKFEFLYFWVSVLPTLVLSSLTSVLSLLSDIFPNFQFWGLILATLSTLNGIIVGVSAFWKWQAKMEKGRFAAQEYDNLKQRLNLWRTKIEYNKMTFLMVLEEVEQTLNDIMKTCGPPDEYLVAKVKQEIAMQAFHAAKRLERRRQQEQVPFWWRCLCCCCWRDLHRHRVGPFKTGRIDRSNKAGDHYTEIGVKCIEDQLIDLEQNHKKSDLGSLFAMFWSMFEAAADRGDLPSCERLLKAVGWDVELKDAPGHHGVLKDDMEELLHWHPNRRTPMHLAAQYQFPGLGSFLVQNFTYSASEHCLKQDSDNNVPYQILCQARIPPDSELHRFKNLLLFETCRRFCVESCSKSEQTSVANDQKLRDVEIMLVEELRGLVTMKRKKAEIYFKKDFPRITCENMPGSMQHSLIHVFAHFGQRKVLEQLFDTEKLYKVSYAMTAEDLKHMQMHHKLKLLCLTSREDSPARYPLGCAILQGHLSTFHFLFKQALELQEYFTEVSAAENWPKPAWGPELHAEFLHMVQESLAALASVPVKSEKRRGTTEGGLQLANKAVAAAAAEDSSCPNHCCLRPDLTVPPEPLRAWGSFTIYDDSRSMSLAEASRKPQNMLQLACGKWEGLHLPERVVRRLVYHKVDYADGRTTEVSRHAEPTEVGDGVRLTAIRMLLQDAAQQDSAALQTKQRLFYMLVRSALECNFKDPIEDLVGFLDEPDVWSPGERCPEALHDLPGWVQQTTKALHDANLDGSRLESSALRHRLRLFCGYVPKNPDNHDQRYNKESLLHVAAYASIRYNSAVSVRLVAMMSVLVDFPATAHYSRESSNLQPPLRYALGTPLKQTDVDGGSSHAEDMIGQGTPHQKAIIQLLLFEDFVYHAMRNTSKSQSGILQPLHDLIEDFFDSPELARGLLEEVLKETHQIRLEGQVQTKTVLHIIGQFALTADFAFIFRQLPSRGRYFAAMFHQADSRGFTIIHYVAEGIISQAIQAQAQASLRDKEAAADSPMRAASFASGEEMLPLDTETDPAPSRAGAAAHEQLWAAVRQQCSKGERSTNEHDRMMLVLLGLLAIDDKEAKLKQFFRRIEHIEWKESEPRDAVSRDVAVHRRDVLACFQKEHLDRNDMNELLRRFGSTTLKGDLVFGWCEILPQQQKIRTLCIGVNAESVKQKDHGILGGAVRWELQEGSPLVVDIMFMRRVCGVACELHAQGDSEEEVCLEIASSQDNARWTSVAIAGASSLTAHPKAASLQLQKIHFQKPVDARYFKISVQPPSTCQLCVGLVLEYKTKIAWQKVGPVKWLPPEMLESWNGPDGGSQSLLYHAARLEHRSCRRLVRISEYSAFGRERKTPFELMNPDSELLADLLVPHFQFLCREAEESLDEGPRDDDQLNSWVSVLDKEMEKFFRGLPYRHKQGVLTEACNYRDNKRTVFHYASMYGLHGTLKALFDEYKRYDDHRHFFDKENKSALSLVCKELLRLFPACKQEIQRCKEAISEDLQPWVDQRQKSRLKSMDTQEEDFARETFHSAAAAGNLHLLKRLMDNWGVEGSDRKRVAKKTNETGVITPLMAACKEGEVEVVQYLLEILSPPEGDDKPRLNADAWKEMWKVDMEGDSCFHLLARKLFEKASSDNASAVNLMVRLLSRDSWRGFDLPKAWVVAGAGAGEKTMMEILATKRGPGLDKVMQLAGGLASNCFDLHRQRCLFAASEHGNRVFVEAMIQEDDDAVTHWMDLRSPAHESVLHALARCRNYDASVDLFRFLEARAEMQGKVDKWQELMLQRGDAKRSPLHWAAETGNAELIRTMFLIKQSPKDFKEWLNAKGVEDKSPIELCTDADAAESLFCSSLVLPEDLNQLDPSVAVRISQLQLQVHITLHTDHADRPERYNYLVKSFRDKVTGKDLLHKLDTVPKDKLTEALIIMQDTGDPYQCPLLHLAVWLMRRNWVIFLLEADADPLKKDTAGRTAVDIAFMRSGEVLESDPEEWKGSRSQDLDVGDDVFINSRNLQASGGNEMICAKVSDWQLGQISEGRLPPADDEVGGMGDFIFADLPMREVDYSEEREGARLQKRDEVLRCRDFFYHTSKVLELLLEKIHRRGRLKECLAIEEDRDPYGEPRGLDRFLERADHHSWWIQLRKEFVSQSLLNFLSQAYDIRDSRVPEILLASTRLCSSNKLKDLQPAHRPKKSGGSVLSLAAWCLQNNTGKHTNNLVQFVHKILTCSDLLECDEGLLLELRATGHERIEVKIREQLMEQKLARFSQEPRKISHVMDTVGGLGTNLLELVVQHASHYKILKLLQLLTDPGFGLFSTLTTADSEALRLEIHSDQGAHRFTRSGPQEGAAGAAGCLLVEELATDASVVDDRRWRSTRVKGLWLERGSGVVYIMLQTGILRIHPPANLRPRMLTKLFSLARGLDLHSTPHPVSLAGNSLLELAVERGDASIVRLLATHLGFGSMSEPSLSTIRIPGGEATPGQKEALKSNNLFGRKAALLESSSKDVKAASWLFGDVFMPVECGKWCSYRVGTCRPLQRTYFEVRAIEMGRGLHVAFDEGKEEAGRVEIVNLLGMDQQGHIYTPLPPHATPPSEGVKLWQALSSDSSDSWARVRGHCWEPATGLTVEIEDLSLPGNAPAEDEAETESASTSWGFQVTLQLKRQGPPEVLVKDQLPEKNAIVCYDGEVGMVREVLEDKFVFRTFEGAWREIALGEVSESKPLTLADGCSYVLISHMDSSEVAFYIDAEGMIFDMNEEECGKLPFYKDGKPLLANYLLNSACSILGTRDHQAADSPGPADQSLLALFRQGMPWLKDVPEKKWPMAVLYQQVGTQLLSQILVEDPSTMSTSGHRCPGHHFGLLRYEPQGRATKAMLCGTCLNDTPSGQAIYCCPAWRDNKRSGGCCASSRSTYARCVSCIETTETTSETEKQSKYTAFLDGAPVIAEKEEGLRSCKCLWVRLPEEDLAGAFLECTDSATNRTAFLMDEPGIRAGVYSRDGTWYLCRELDMEKPQKEFLEDLLAGRLTPLAHCRSLQGKDEESGEAGDASSLEISEYKMRAVKVHFNIAPTKNSWLHVATKGGGLCQELCRSAVPLPRCQKHDLPLLGRYWEDAVDEIPGLTCTTCEKDLREYSIFYTCHACDQEEIAKGFLSCDGSKNEDGEAHRLVPTDWSNTKYEISCDRCGASRIPWSYRCLTCDFDLCMNCRNKSEAPRVCHECTLASLRRLVRNQCGAPVTVGGVAGVALAWDVQQRKWEVAPENGRDLVLADASDVEPALPTVTGTPVTSQEVKSVIWTSDRRWLQGDVLCFAVDLVRGHLKVALNGVWSQAIHIKGLEPNKALCPIVAGADFQHAFGFRPKECLYGPPFSGPTTIYSSRGSLRQLIDGPGLDEGNAPRWQVVPGTGPWLHIGTAPPDPLWLTANPETKQVSLQPKKKDSTRQKWAVARNEQGSFSIRSLAEPLDESRWLLSVSSDAQACLAQDSPHDGPERQMWAIDSFEEWLPLPAPPAPPAQRKTWWAGTSTPEDCQPSQNVYDDGVADSTHDEAFDRVAAALASHTLRRA